MILKKIVKIVLIILVIIVAFCGTFYLLMHILFNKITHLPRDITVRVINKIEYEETDTIFTTEIRNEEMNATSFWVVTSSGEVELFKIQYTGLREQVKYRKYNEYIFFWLNGNGYETAEMMNNKPRKELRRMTDARLYRYNIVTAEIIEMPMEDSDRTIIIDVLFDGTKEIIIKEVATVQNKHTDWEDMVTYIGDIKYNFSVTDYYMIEYRGLILEEGIVVPTVNFLAIAQGSHIEKKFENYEEYRAKANLYLYGETMIAVNGNSNIKVYNSYFEIVDEYNFANFYSEHLLLKDKIVFYRCDETDSVVFGVTKLDTLESWEVLKEQKMCNPAASETGLKYDPYNDVVFLYDKITGENIAQY